MKLPSNATNILAPLLLSPPTLLNTATTCSSNHGSRNGNTNLPHFSTGPRNNSSHDFSGYGSLSRGSSNGSNSHNSNPPSTRYHGFCQWCGQQGHSAKFYPRLQSSSQQQPVANYTTRPCIHNWILDSRCCI